VSVAAADGAQEVPTIKEVAARAGVSPSTVSNVFLGRVPVKEGTKRRVLLAARRLGYRPDGRAQALRTGRTRTLGLCVPFITNPTVAAIVNGAARAAQEAGYAVSVCTIENEPDLQATYLDLLRRDRVAAVISQPAGRDPEPYATLQRAGAALVFVDRRLPGLTADFLTPDYRGAVRQAVAHLLAAGRRRVALITGPRWIDSTLERIAGYEAAHRAAGLAVDESLVLASEGASRRSPREAIDDLLGRSPAPDALVAGSADVTLTALARLKAGGRAVPGSVALIGTGQLAWAPLADPPLSMIEVDGEALGREAVRLALSRLGAPQTAPREITLPARLVLRASSG
jgi:LacI family transcriptional regulator